MSGWQVWGGAGMSVRLVLVLGVRQLMDQLLMARGITPTFVAGYRISDSDVMVAAAEATGAARVQVEAALSRVPLPPPPSPLLPLPPPSRATLPAPHHQLMNGPEARAGTRRKGSSEIVRSV